MALFAPANRLVTWSLSAALLLTACSEEHRSAAPESDDPIRVPLDSGSDQEDGSATTRDAAVGSDELDGSLAQQDGSAGAHDASVGSDELDGALQSEDGSLGHDAAPGDAAGPDPVRTEHWIGAEIAADCSADVTEALQEALDALEPGSTLHFPPMGCFLLPRSIILGAREDVVIEGHGATLLRTALTPQAQRYPRHNGHLALEDVAQVVVRDLNVVGTNIGHDHGGAVLDARGNTHPVECVGEGFGCYCIGFEFEHAFAVRDSAHVTLDNLRADAIWGDGVYLEGSDDVLVRDVEVDRNGRQGMAVISGERIVIDGARVLHSRRGGIDLEPNKAADRIAHIEIKDSEIRSHLLAFPAGGAGEVGDVYIHDNTILRSGVPWVYSRGKEALKRARWRVEDNIVLSTLSSVQPGVSFEHTRDVSVRRNVVPFKSDREMTAVGLAFGSEAVIECNHFPGAARVDNADEASGSVQSDNSLSSVPPECQ